MSPDKTIRQIFLIMALLIIVVYFVGASTDTNSLANGITKLVLALTGRNSQGQFASYPGGTNNQVQGG